MLGLFFFFNFFLHADKTSLYPTAIQGPFRSSGGAPRVWWRFRSPSGAPRGWERGSALCLVAPRVTRAVFTCVVATRRNAQGPNGRRLTHCEGTRAPKQSQDEKAHLAEQSGDRAALSCLKQNQHGALQPPASWQPAGDGARAPPGCPRVSRRAGCRSHGLCERAGSVSQRAASPGSF